jgi:hypothetical protein
MARKFTPSPHAAETRADAAWLRAALSHETCDLLPREAAKDALVAGARLRSVEADPHARLPSTLIPLLP